MDTEWLITELKILQRMYFDIYKYNEADSISKLNAIAEKMLSIASFLSTESYSLQWSVDCKIIALIDMWSDIQKYQKSRNDTQGLYDEFIRTSL